MSLEEVQIGDNCQVLSAKRIFAKDYVATGIPFYRSKEIIYKAFNQFKNDEVFIKEEGFNEDYIDRIMPNVIKAQKLPLDGFFDSNIIDAFTT